MAIAVSLPSATAAYESIAKIKAKYMRIFSRLLQTLLVPVVFCSQPQTAQIRMQPCLFIFYFLTPVLNINVELLASLFFNCVVYFILPHDLKVFCYTRKNQAQSLRGKTTQILKNVVK